ncbi:MAG: CPBP family intramembrane glutamic endopeptidase [Sedimentisphaerales bacterium]|jgi:membrane protease YdiL (CAAX protease family)
MARRRQRAASNQWFNFARDSYLERTSRPVYAIVYLLPFIIFYELGTIFINTDVLSQTQVRVVAFVWLQELLRHLGFGGKFLWAAPALVVVVILLAYQLVSRKRWWVSFGDMLPMTIECVLLAIPLIVLSLFLNSTGTPKHSRTNDVVPRVIVVQCAAEQTAAPTKTKYLQPKPTVIAKPKPQSSLLADIVTGIGAGIYEELLFRLILICAIMLLLQDVIGINQHSAVIIAVLISAALFGAHHHFDFLTGRANQSDLFDWSKFAFRTAAGVYFAALFAIRGFGITAGTHAFYDIIATLINAIIFQR